MKDRRDFITSPANDNSSRERYVTHIRPFGSQASTLTEPKLEFAFEVRLHFTRVQTIAHMPTGAERGGVYLDSGEFQGPRLRGKAVWYQDIRYRLCQDIRYTWIG
jgi:hypothetical protein